MRKHQLQIMRDATGLPEEELLDIACQNLYTYTIARMARHEEFAPTALLTLMVVPVADGPQETPDDLPTVSPAAEPAAVPEAPSGKLEHPPRPPVSTPAEALAKKSKKPLPKPDLDDTSLRHRILRLAARQTQAFTAAEIAEHDLIRSTSHTVGGILSKVDWPSRKGPSKTKLWQPRSNPTTEN